MARIGGSRHLKALAAPAWWPIKRKEFKWTVKPSPGPHPIERSLPLLIVVRDLLGYAKTSREARKLIAEGHFKVDGVVRKDYKFPIGPMDVLEIPKTGEAYRVLPAPTTFLTLHPISREEARLKIVRIEDKSTVRGGHIQLHLHDGRNILVRVSDPRRPAEGALYETRASLLITIPEQEIKSYVPLREGAIAIVIGGRLVGRVGVVKSIQWSAWKKARSIVTLEDARGQSFQTILEYIMVIGSDKPLISLPEGVWR
ncbi:MAG: 30S ribosomal protein S4e [Acidilobaceae archaeon]